MKGKKYGAKRLEKHLNRDGIELPGVPLVEICGDRRVLIEHHMGVVAYGRSEIRVRVKYGIIAVGGSGLDLARMTKEQLVICGCIDSVILIKERGAGHGGTGAL